MKFLSIIASLIVVAILFVDQTGNVFGDYPYLISILLVSEMLFFGFAFKWDFRPRPILIDELFSTLVIGIVAVISLFLVCIKDFEVFDRYTIPVVVLAVLISVFFLGFFDEKKDGQLKKPLGIWLGRGIGLVSFIIVAMMVVQQWYWVDYVLESTASL